jgi:WD40 repeat protein
VESRKWKVFGVVVLLVFLVSCEGQVKPTVEIPVSVSPSASATRTSVPTHLPFPTFTETPRLADTVTPDFTTPTLTSVQATIETLASFCDGESGRRSDILSFDQSFSPNGEWISILCGGYRKIFRVDGSQSWNFKFQEMYEHDAPGFIKTHHWPKDGRYAYLSAQISDMDGPGMIFVDGWALYRLDLSNGNISTVLQPVPYLSYSFAFSPTDRYLIYTHPRQPKLIHVYEFSSGEDITFSLGDDYVIAGIFLWSPDGKKVVFSAARENWFETDDGFSLFMVDLSKQQINFLVSGKPHEICAKEWLSDNKILVAEWTTYWSGFVFDLSKMELSELSTPVYPTP